MSDGWHIDGRIVAKNGYLTVKKDFVGTPEVIEAIRKNYYISVDMDEKLLDGRPQPPGIPSAHEACASFGRWTDT